MIRTISRALALTTALALAGAALASPVRAHDTDARKWRKSESARNYDRPAKRTRKVETMEDIDANGYDPACNYCGYPSWARSALSPKDGGGSGGRN
jgi:hypothetical protein